MTDVQELAKQGEGYKIRDYGDELWLIHIGPHSMPDGTVGRATRFVASINPICREWAIENLGRDLDADFKDISEITARFYPEK